jgi:hypothetical protein
MYSLSSELSAGGSAPALLEVVQGLPAILAAMFLFRGLLMCLEAPLLGIMGPRMSWQVRRQSSSGRPGGGGDTTVRLCFLNMEGRTVLQSCWF